MCSTPAVFFILSGSVSTCTSMFIVTVRGRTTTVEPSNFILIAAFSTVPVATPVVLKLRSSP